MPRPPRSVLPGQPLHLIQRGNNRSLCFVDDEDRAHYKRVLRESSERAGCAIHAYVLMPNHVHLLVTARHTRSPSLMMQTLGGRFVRYFNDRHERTGTLWEGRFRSTMVDSERYLLACSRYIEMNPVRAGLATEPQHYTWSSYRRNALGEADGLVTSHPVYAALGNRRALRLAFYRALFTTELEDDVEDVIRRGTNSGLMLGPRQSVAAAERALRRRLTGAAHGGDRRSDRFIRGDKLPGHGNRPRTTPGR